MSYMFTCTLPLQVQLAASWHFWSSKRAGRFRPRLSANPIGLGDRAERPPTDWGLPKFHSQALIS